MIGIIGILAAALLVGINPVFQIEKGRDATRKSDLRQIQSALELYRADQGFYPTSANFPPACKTSFTVGSVTYMQAVPCDPLDGTKYSYTSLPSGCDNSATYCLQYQLYACLENTQDPSKDDSDGGPNDLCSTTGRVSTTVKNP